MHRPVGSNGYGWGYVRPVSGFVNPSTASAKHHYMIGVHGATADDRGGEACIVWVPTNTSPVIDVQGCSDDDCLYVYR